ncbi:hypothetical protein AOLI_G00283710 [Acnodon oligacanthus]
MFLAPASRKYNKEYNEDRGSGAAAGLKDIQPSSDHPNALPHRPWGSKPGHPFWTPPHWQSELGTEIKGSAKTRRVLIGLAPDENVLASFSTPPTGPPLFALLGTHGTAAAASGRADYRQLRIVFTSWDAWHSHFINYLWLLLGAEGAMNYLALQLQT